MQVQPNDTAPFLFPPRSVHRMRCTLVVMDAVDAEALAVVIVIRERRVSVRIYWVLVKHIFKAYTTFKNFILGVRNHLRMRRCQHRQQGHR